MAHVFEEPAPERFKWENTVTIDMNDSSRLLDSTIWRQRTPWAAIARAFSEKPPSLASFSAQRAARAQEQEQSRAQNAQGGLYQLDLALRQIVSQILSENLSCDKKVLASCLHHLKKLYLTQARTSPSPLDIPSLLARFSDEADRHFHSIVISTGL